MKKRISFFVSFTLFISLLFLSCASSAKAKPENNNISDNSIKVGTMENGMSYFIKENDQPKNRIELRLVVRAGSCMEEEDQKGIAHFVEHMCYNGTKNFEKSGIVDFFESIGMAFGPEVNAETSFESTIYIIQIPADDEEILKKALLVLHDWASEVTFDPEELDKERGVIIEEWRTRTLGLQGRYSMKQVDILGENSQYSKRVPIGDVNIIKTIPVERVKDFYNKWYRPEFMSVIAVGDFKTQNIEKSIKEAMSVIPSSKDTIEHPDFNVPYDSTKKIEILEDEESKYTETVLYSQRKDNHIIKTRDDMKKAITASMGQYILNQRFEKITQTANAAWLYAACGEATLSKTCSYKTLYFVNKQGKFNECLHNLLEENERFIKFGITEDEYTHVKAAFIQSFEQQLKNTENFTSNSYCNSIISNIFNGTRIIPVDASYKENIEIVNEITAEEIKEVYKEYFESRGNKLYILTPKGINEIPSKKEIMNVWNNYSNENIEQQKEEAKIENLTEIPASKGKVISKKKNSHFGTKEYTLDNGIKIITKKTDNTKDYINIYAVSKGGVFKVSEEDVPSTLGFIDNALYSGEKGVSYNQYLKFCTEKNIQFGTGFTDTTEYLSAGSNNNNLEYVLQCMKLIFEKEDFTDDAWQIIQSNIEASTSMFGKNPDDYYLQKINEMVYGKTNYYASVDKNFASQMSKEKSKQLFKERFGNPADFTYIFVGDMDEKKLLDLCCRYLGTLKTTSDFEEAEYKLFPFPQGINKAVVKKGIDNKGKVYIGFGGEMPESDDLEQQFKESCILNDLIYLLDIRLREVVREDNSGTYGVGVNGYIMGNTKRNYLVSISFNCAPEREEELIDAVLKEIERLKVEDVSEENLTKIRENIIRGNENGEKYNSWWINRICVEEILKYEPEWVLKNPNKMTEWVTSENLKEFINKYLKTDRYVNVNLVPEK